jgi:hypothetical protein
VALAVIVASAHAFVLTVSHDSPVANPFIVAASCRRGFTKSSLLPRASTQNDRVLARSSRRQMRRTAAISCSVSRSSNPLSAAYRGVAQLFLTSMSASLADQRRTDKTSNPDWANHLPGHPAPFVRFVRTVGSPQSCSGARYRRSTISGRFRGRNLVGLGPQSKCFFSYQECGPLMRPPHDHGPGDA